jgi:hypothetical protein
MDERSRAEKKIKDKEHCFKLASLWRSHMAGTTTEHRYQSLVTDTHVSTLYYSPISLYRLYLICTINNCFPQVVLS